MTVIFMVTKLMFYFFLTMSLMILAGCGEKAEQRSEIATTVKSASFDEVISKSNCLACHMQGNQMGAPSWREVAIRYKRDKKAESFLMHKIAQGGSGSWGTMDMPPYKELSEPELRVSVRGILATKQ